MLLDLRDDLKSWRTCSLDIPGRRHSPGGVKKSQTTLCRNLGEEGGGRIFEGDILAAVIQVLLQYGYLPYKDCTAAGYEHSSDHSPIGWYTS